MKITRQLCLDGLAADGTAATHLTITWEGNFKHFFYLSSEFHQKPNYTR